MSKKDSVVVGAQLWGEQELAAEVLGWRCGPLLLWSKRVADEVWIAFEYSQNNNESDNELTRNPEKMNWSRWVVKTAKQHLRFVPVFPDKPLVVQPEYPFRLVRGAEARIYVRVPLWIRIEDSSKQKNVITEIPTVILSKTWFGSFTQGEVCYWISTGARRQIEPDPARPFLAICPLQIFNGSDMDLHVEKLALRVELLSLFESKMQLWSNEMKINYRGKNEISQINVTNQPPAEALDGTTRSSARAVVKKGIAARTFSTIRDFTGFDFLTK